MRVLNKNLQILLTIDYIKRKKNIVYFVPLTVNMIIRLIKGISIVAISVVGFLKEIFDTCKSVQLISHPIVFSHSIQFILL